MSQSARIARIARSGEKKNIDLVVVVVCCCQQDPKSTGKNDDDTL